MSFVSSFFNRLRANIAVQPDKWIGAAFALAAFFLYARTMPPTVLDGDSGEYQYMAYILGVPHSSGYPLYILIAKLFTYLPIGDVAYRVNLFSVVAAAASAPVLYFIARRLSLSRASAILTTAILLTTPSLWGGAVQAKTYALHVLFGLLTIFFAVRWHQENSRRDFFAAAFAFGLGLTNHHVIIFLAPALLTMLWLDRARVNRGLLGRGLLLALVPLLLYAYIPIRANQLIAEQDPANKLLYPREDAMVKGTVTAYYNNTPQGFFLLVTGLDNYFKIGYLDDQERTNRFVNAARLLWEQFGVGIVLIVVGAVVSFRRDRQLFAFLAAITTGIAFVAIAVRALSTVYYFSLAYIALAWWLGYGVDFLLSLWNAPTRANPSAAHGAAAAPYAFIAMTLLVLLPVYALVTNYAAIDQSGNYDSRRTAEFLLRDNLAPNAVVIAPWEVATPLRYLQFVENKRPDLLIANVSPIWPQFTALHDRAGELGRAFYNVEFNPEFKQDNVFRSAQAVPMPLLGAPHPTYAVQKKILPEVQVIGYDLAPDPPMPGQAVRVSIYYRTLARMFPIYSSELSVSSILGVPVKAIPSFPSSFSYPTYRWRADEIYRDVYAFVVPSTSPAGLYTVDLAWYPYDLDTHVSDRTKENALSLGAIRVGEIQAPASIAHPSTARVGGAITFLGWDSSAAARESVVAARGQSIPLDLFWRADQTLAESYTVFVHLVNAEGQVVTDADSPPFSGLYATNLWRVGESLRDRHLLAIPPNLPPGKYTLEIGMYLPSSGNRLTIEVGSDRMDKMVLASVDVR